MNLSPSLLRFLLVGVLPFCGVAAASLAATPTKPQPNIIVIMTDDMGYSDLGCYGGEINTPHLDGLAGEGVRFTQFYNTGRCCPTRAALLTGVYSHQAGIGHMIADRGSDGYRGELNKRTVTIAEALRPVGYRNYAVGKWHVSLNTNESGSKHNWPLQRGFDRYYGTITGAGSFFDPGTLTRDNKAISAMADPEYSSEGYYYTDAISAHAVRYIQEHRREHQQRPFFMYVAYTAAHWPLHAKEADISKYKGRYDQGYEVIRQARLEKARKLGVIDPAWTPSPLVGDWDKEKHKEWEARCMEVYAAQVDSMDQGVGRIVSALKEQGLFENTLILFLQDNGGCAETIGRDEKTTRSDQPTFPVIPDDVPRPDVRPKQTRAGFAVLTGRDVMPGPADTYIAYGEAWANVSNTPFGSYKHYQHEGGISTPLIAHWPAGIARRNAIENQPGHLIDIMATCVDLVGAGYPTEHAGNQIIPRQGVSLQKAFAGESLERAAPLFFEHEGNRAVRDGRWKLVAKNPGGKWELYDMEADRTEQHDLAASEPQRLQELVGKWETWAKDAGVLPWPWKPAYGQKEAPPQRKFQLKQGDNLSGDEAPVIKDQGFSIQIEVTQAATDGVLLAQGGSAEGYAVYMKSGKLTFALRSQGKLTTISAPDSFVLKPATLTASLTQDGTMTLQEGDQTLATGKGGVLKRQPKDGLQVGRDTNGAVGDYSAPFVFPGKLGSVTVNLLP